MQSVIPEVHALRPWYHDFSRFGLQTHVAPRRIDQLGALLAPLRRLFNRGYVEKGERFSLRGFLRPQPPAHVLNQRVKEIVIEDYLRRCLREMSTQAPTCLDLFCADGYYACLLASLSPAAHVTGVDLDAREITRARTAARLLNFPHLQFEGADVWEFVARPNQRFDLILCAGGLYHLERPRQFLQALRALAGGYLVLQSVVTLESQDPSYFMTPAPGWKHGSRFTHAALERWLIESGWQILNQTLNELPANPRLCDRGSSYYRCIAA